MYKVFFLSLGLFFFQTSFSQYTDTTSAQKIVEPKNSIGINISPIITVLTGSNRFDPVASLLYKRHLEKVNFRVSANYKFHSSNGLFGSYSNLVKVVDSVYTFEHRQYTNQTFDARFGLEWMKKKNKFSWAVGGEIILGGMVSDNDVFSSERIYEKDSLGNVFQQSYIYPYGKDVSTFTRNNYFTSGLGLILGMEFDLTRQLSVSAQINPTMTYRIGLNQNVTEIDYSKNEPANTTVSSLDYSFITFDISAVNVYLNFKF